MPGAVVFADTAGQTHCSPVRAARGVDPLPVSHGFWGTSRPSLARRPERPCLTSAGPVPSQCRPAAQGRHFGLGAAHACWCAAPRWLLPPCGQGRNRSSDPAHAQLSLSPCPLLPAGRTKVSIVTRVSRMRSDAAHVDEVRRPANEVWYCGSDTAHVQWYPRACRCRAPVVAMKYPGAVSPRSLVPPSQEPPPPTCAGQRTAAPAPHSRARPWLESYQTCGFLAVYQGFAGVDFTAAF